MSSLGRQFEGKNIPLAKLGVSVVSADEERHLRKAHAETRHEPGTVTVPLSQVRAGQNTVDLQPGYRRSAEKDSSEPVTGRHLPDGKLQLENGHHRLAEAQLRGDTHIAVRTTSYGAGKCYEPGGCPYGYRT